MNQVRGFAKFEQRGEYTFRTQTYLQFGESSESIGSCLMLNPGAAEQIHPDSYEVKLDNTMRQLVLILNNIYNKQQREGRFHIYNVFPLQNPKSGAAIESLENLVSNGTLSYEECIPSLEELQTHPWLMIAWGVETNKRWKHLSELRKRWMSLVLYSKVPYFGKLNASGKYYHPCPRLHAKRIEMVEDMKRIYTEKFDTHTS